MTGPFSDIKVVDLTSMISGPLCTMILADQGADVIKVEAPGGDFSRHVATRRGGFSASFVNNNRNKRSVCLDLKQPAALQALKQIVADSDVFVQNFRPGVADRIGVGEAAIRAARPDIIYVSICGFGETGPYARKPVFDPLIQAVSGLSSVQGGSDSERPRLVRTILPDKLTAIQTSQAISAALYARLRTGNGQHIRVSMLDTLVFFLWGSDMGGHTFVGDELETETAQSYIDLIYETLNGYISVAIVADKHWQGLSQAVDRPDFLSDERFQSAELREIHKDARTRLTQEALLHFNSEDIQARLEEHDVPCAPVLSRKSMLQHPQIVANEIVMHQHHPQAGELRQARQPAQFSDTSPDYRRPAPALGQHTADVLSEHGVDTRQLGAASVLASAIDG